MNSNTKDLKSYSSKSKEILNVFLLLLRLIMGRLLKPLWVLLIVFFIILYLNSSYLLSQTELFGIPHYALIKDYLATLISFPVIVLILGLIIIYKFKDSIDVFLRNSKLKGFAGVETSQFSKKASNDTSLIPSPSMPDTSQDDTQTKNPFEFLFLDLFLVPTTKTALEWIGLQDEVTIDNFNANFNISATILNPLPEKNAILSVLIKYNLIEKKDNKVTITEKGKSYLIRLGSII